jgi:hypothetical protein
MTNADVFPSSMSQRHHTNATPVVVKGFVAGGSPGVLDSCLEAS